MREMKESKEIDKEKNKTRKGKAKRHIAKDHGMKLEKEG